MQLIDELVAEHALIERVVGSLRTFARARRTNDADATDGPRFMRFFRQYAGHFHHAREEDTLFVSLARHVELPTSRGPIAALLADHQRMAGILDEMEPLIGREALDDAERDRLHALVEDYAASLWHHIDAENSVLLPESEHRLRRRGVAELPSRPMTPEEDEARVIGQQLLERYPPTSDADIVRGDGCVLCPAYSESCDGLEREWWNEWEWEEFDDHLPSG